MTALIIQSIISGILLGGIYSLIAAGLTLVCGVMNIFNFAHGAMVMLGMYTSFWLWKLLGIHPYLSIIIIIPIFMLFGMLIYKVILDSSMNADEYMKIFLILGLMFLIENMVLFFWGADFRTANVKLSNATFYVRDIMISVSRLIAFIGSVFFSLLLYFILKYSDFGKSLRAAAEEKEGAVIVGINVRRVYTFAFGIGAACAGVAGALIIPFSTAFPDVGNLFLITIFVVIVLGGMGSYIGALIGGVIIGVAESIAAVFMPGSMKITVSLLIFVLVLLFKPEGLFRK
jgi:branched-chain amino acid transport system permease protein